MSQQPRSNQRRSAIRRAQPATPASSRRPLPPMPRQVREAPVPARLRPAMARRTVFGRPWPLPISPVALGLLLAFAVAAGAAWYFEGRYETPPAQAAKLLIPYKADQIQAATLTTPDGTATLTRDASGKLVGSGPALAPTATPGPDATPAPVAPVALSPGTKLDGLINQLHDLSVDRVLLKEPSASPEFGLDKPQVILALTPKRGAPSTLAIGKVNPDQTDYYVRREDKKDTVLVSKFTLDDLIKVAGDIVKGT